MDHGPGTKAGHRCQIRILAAMNQYVTVQEKRHHHSSTTVRVANHTFEINGSGHPPEDLSVRKYSAQTFSVIYKGRSLSAHVQRVDHENMIVTVGDQPVAVSIADHRSQLLEQYGVSLQAVRSDADVRSPMPGLVVSILVSPGDMVDNNQGLLVLEAMKMENELRASSAGRVVSVLVQTGDTVSKDDLLVELVPVSTLS